ncbi:FCD domain-containing protein [Acuticoccus sp. MNP-M23]|uniref:FadR/GntR family transcriptional regulator n=1 Tax=Acuticoccus sp. MNP-M23 TaxID=3072793 RepID=UPI0028156C28|nr:FCD domain-containing protein [Acuticoccus sp. MNP-M23]WMS45122.1 FCD domain-containing protein [Acuticoccus sp. MNP-M23]
MSEEREVGDVFGARLETPTRLADAVSDAIAAALFDGRIRPGDPLPSEGVIAREFGVSKPIAREALRQLAGAGLIHTQQGKVARAKPLNGEPLDRFYGYAVRSSLTRLREANEMRLVVERGIAQLAARRQAAAGLAAMHSAVAAMEKALKKSDAFTDSDVAFHHGMALATGNRMIEIQMEGLRAVQREVSDLFSRRSNRTDADWVATVERHRHIVCAIEAGDEAGAEAAMVAHYAAADIASFEVADTLSATDTLSTRSAPS